MATDFLELAGDVGEAGYGRNGEFRMAVDEGAVGAQAVALEVAAEGWLPIVANERLRLTASVNRAILNRST